MKYETMRRASDAVPTIDQLPSRRRENFPEIEDVTFWELYDRCKDYSVVHVPGFYNVFQSLLYLAANHIRGNAVECGCFLGGIAMFMGLCRERLALQDVEIILFDTFEGAPAGSADLVLGRSFTDESSLPSYREAVPEAISSVVGSIAGYRFVAGLVEDTLRDTNTGDIALLRLDTDYYSSTAIEHEILYPKLVSGGVLIVDDYGMFQGARRATDEYFARLEKPPLLNRIDISVWAGVKP